MRSWSFCRRGTSFGSKPLLSRSVFLVSSFENFSLDPWNDVISFLRGLSDVVNIGKSFETLVRALGLLLTFQTHVRQSLNGICHFYFFSLGVDNDIVLRVKRFRYFGLLSVSLGSFDLQLRWFLLRRGRLVLSRTSNRLHLFIMSIHLEKWISRFLSITLLLLWGGKSIWPFFGWVVFITRRRRGILFSWWKWRGQLDRSTNWRSITIFLWPMRISF